MNLRKGKDLVSELYVTNRTFLISAAAVWEDQEEKIIFPCPSSGILYPYGFFLSLDSEVEIVLVHVYVINLPVVLLSL